MFEKLFAALHAERESLYEDECRRLRGLNKKKADQCALLKEQLTVSHQEVADLLIKLETSEAFGHNMHNRHGDWEHQLDEKDWEIERLENKVVTLNQCVEIQLEVIERDLERMRCEKLIARGERVFSQSGQVVPEQVIKDDPHATI